MGGKIYMGESFQDFEADFHYSVDFIFLSFGIMGFIVEL